MRSWRQEPQTFKVIGFQIVSTSMLMNLITCGDIYVKQEKCTMLRPKALTIN